MYMYLPNCSVDFFKYICTCIVVNKITKEYSTIQCMYMYMYNEVHCIVHVQQYSTVYTVHVYMYNTA